MLELKTRQIKDNLEFGALFDIDGTIINSLPCHLQAWRETITANGGTINEITFFDEVTKFPSRRIVENFFPVIKNNPVLVDKILKEKIDRYQNLASKQINEIVVPGFLDFISALTNNRIALGFVTSLEKDEFEFVLKKLILEDLFKVIVSAKDVSEHKPSPMCYLEGAKRLGFEPSKCVGFEDSFTGIESINRAGMKCVVVGTTLSETDLQNRRLKYDLYISDFSTLRIAQLADLFLEQT